MQVSAGGHSDGEGGIGTSGSCGMAGIGISYTIWSIVVLPFRHQMGSSVPRALVKAENKSNIMLNFSCHTPWTVRLRKVKNNQTEQLN
jgi:uncharacterized membrane protein YhiD involved in acid resistance